MAEIKKGESKDSPKKYDYTSTKRGRKRTALDNAWAKMVSGGKYKTLRNLMRAVHAKEYALAETPLTLAIGERSPDSQQVLPADVLASEGTLPEPPAIW